MHPRQGEATKPVDAPESPLGWGLPGAAAALSYILVECPVPVLFVGAQRSSDRGSSDAAMNLICAAKFIARSDFAGVAICMHAGMSDDYCNILPARNTVKLHSSRRDAFKPVNATEIAKVAYKGDEINFIADKYPKRFKGKCVIKPGMEDKVALLKIHVNMFPEQFKVFKGFKGLVIEGTGLGHTPGQTPDDISKAHAGIYDAIRELIDSGCKIVMTTQCLFGRVNMHVYDKGADLLKLGVAEGKEIPNTELVKLSWELANQ
jgi:glutamyl-tRNA(Gln) amidotransferase subunit D